MALALKKIVEDDCFFWLTRRGALAFVSSFGSNLGRLSVGITSAGGGGHHAPRFSLPPAENNILPWPVNNDSSKYQLYFVDIKN